MEIYPAREHHAYKLDMSYSFFSKYITNLTSVVGVLINIQLHKHPEQRKVSVREMNQPIAQLLC